MDVLAASRVLFSANAVIFSKSTCPYCVKAKVILQHVYGVDLISYAQIRDGAGPGQVCIYEIDEEVGGGDVGRALVSLTGQKTVPNIFIGQKHIGGCSELEALHQKGMLRPMLRSSGLVCIAHGERVPSCKTRHIVWNAEGKATVDVVDTASIFAGKRTIVVGVPGAFTPTCSEKHLPGFVSMQAEFRALGFDSIVCMSVNDHFVSKSWGGGAGGGGMVSFLADGNGDFSRALGVLGDSRKGGLGFRCKRFVMAISDGVVQDIAVEKPMTLDVSSAESTLKRLRATSKVKTSRL